LGFESDLLEKFFANVKPAKPSKDYFSDMLKKCEKSCLLIKRFALPLWQFQINIVLFFFGRTF
jgi:hypothetical protein